VCGGWVYNRPKPKKELKTGDIKLPMSVCYREGNYKINPLKILEMAPFSDFQGLIS
jgi:hypothetical protein